MKFKIGDRVKIKGDNRHRIFEITEISKGPGDIEFVSFMIDINNEDNYSDVAWHEEELEAVITLDEVKTFAEWQTDIQTVFEIPLISFDYAGIAITNPWIDETGRFELDNKQAIRNYGVENYTKFIKEAVKALKFAKEDGYKL